MTAASRSAVCGRRYALPVAGEPDPNVFVFFSNRLGCLGSLLVSAVLTIILLLILGVL
jgi:hypothetical protein